MNKYALPEKLFLILFIIAIVYQIFIPPHIGIADNGDFARIIDKVGILTGDNKEYMEFINLSLPVEFRYNVKGYQSSELIFVLTSLGLNSFLSKDGDFHFLLIAAVHSLTLITALALLANGMLIKRRLIRWVVYLAILLFFTDVGYLCFLNSIYSEPASIIFLTLTLSVFFMIIRFANTGEVPIIWLSAYFLASFLFVIAKPQNAAMGVPLAFLGYLLSTRLPVKKINLPSLLSSPKRIGILFASGLLLASFLFFAFGLPRYYRSGDLWNSIFLEILGNSQTPEKDLQVLGLPAEMIIYQGTNAFSPGVNRNEWEDFQSSWLYFRVFKFYLLNPNRLWELTHISTEQAFELQQSNLGNFESSSGQDPYAKSKAFSFWNDLRFTALPKSIWTLIVLLLINVGAATLKMIKLDKSPSDRLVSSLHLTFVFMAVLQYMTVLMAEGTFELVKHMLLFNVLMDITFVFILAYLVSIKILFDKPRLTSTQA